MGDKNMHMEERERRLIFKGNTEDKMGMIY